MSERKPGDGTYGLEARDDGPGAGGDARRRPEARIEAKGLLEGFDEDADFERNPEVEAAFQDGKRTKRDRTREAALADPSRWLMRPGFPGARVSLIVGATLTVGAIVMAAIRAEEGAWLRGVWTLYEVALTTLLGLFALVSAAYFSERGLNEVPTALARVLVPTSAALLAFNLDIPIPTRSDEMLLAGAVYYAVALGVFRLPRFETNILCLGHFGLWLVVRMGIELGSRAA